VHNNFYFLKQLSKALAHRLTGTVISECFSQSKDELIIRFETASSPFFLRAGLQPEFTCLSFPENIQRAKRNSVDLFDDIIGRRVSGIVQFNNERSFSLQLSDGFNLVFKMHAKRSNIVLFEGEHVTSLFKNTMEADRLLSFVSLHREIDFSYEAFLRHLENLPALYITFGKIIWEYLSHLNFNTASTEEKWSMIKTLLADLETPKYYILLNNRPSLSLVKVGTVHKSFEDPLEATNEFYFFYIHNQAFSKEREQALTSLKANLRKSLSYREKIEQKLAQLENDTSYKSWADLLMANLHQVSAGSEKTILSDFSTGAPVEIKLKRELSPQKNAELFYKKSKNQHLEIQHLKKNIQEKSDEIKLIHEKIGELENITDLKQLRKNQEGGADSKERERKKTPVPYHEFEWKGFRIWVGKNAQSNDVLTLKYSYKEDLWLHVKDVSGSHVLIKHQAGKNFPKDVIERAAQLAAYNSKRKNESLCPVIVTPKKFVRKRKGDPPGAVIVEREEVIMVRPEK
jgi:predicted ribosome quality control (RQC) complex YloA/Tae2 family protein